MFHSKLSKLLAKETESFGFSSGKIRERYSMRVPFFSLEEFSSSSSSGGDIMK